MQILSFHWPSLLHFAIVEFLFWLLICLRDIQSHIREQRCYFRLVYLQSHISRRDTRYGQSLPQELRLLRFNWLRTTELAAKASWNSSSWRSNLMDKVISVGPFPRARKDLELGLNLEFWQRLSSTQLTEWYQEWIDIAKFRSIRFGDFCIQAVEHKDVWGRVAEVAGCRG